MTFLSSLVTTAWLAEHLNDDGLRVLDATVQMPIPGENTGKATGGYEQYERAHIPGAQFADLRKALSGTDPELYFSLPDEQQFGQQMGRLGVSENSYVVVYSAAYTGWATRLWWLLKTFGHRNVAVLDGGLKKWQQEQRRLKSGREPINEQEYTARLDENYVALKDEVLSSVTGKAGSYCLIDSLSAAYYRGEAGDMYGYGRLGHIAGAINVPTDELINQETGEFLSLEDLREKFNAVLNAPGKKLITYCGGGIAATQNAFALHLLGRSDVAVYNDSLQEWSKNESLPMTVGQ